MAWAAGKVNRKKIIKSELERMSRQTERLRQALLSRPGLRWLPAKVFPAVNVTEDKDNYHVRAELPGIKAEALELQVTGRTLSISGDRPRYHRREREAGKFSRIVGLPGDIDADRVNAKMTHGVLTVTIAKAEISKPKQIAVS